MYSIDIHDVWKQILLIGNKLSNIFMISVYFSSINDVHEAIQGFYKLVDSKAYMLLI